MISVPHDAPAGSVPISAEHQTAMPYIDRQHLFEEGGDGFALYRIPGIVVTARGTVLAYCEARKFTGADRGELEIHLRRSTDGGRTWDAARQVAHSRPAVGAQPVHAQGQAEQKYGRSG
jgi:sialidase-1